MLLSLLLIIIKKIINKMNAGFVMISILVKSNLSDKYLFNALYSIDTKILRYYLGIAEIYDGNNSKSNRDLIEMIVYGYIKGILNKIQVNDISLTSAYKIIKDKDINIKLLPGYGNMSLKRKDILAKYNK